MRQNLNDISTSPQSAARLDPFLGSTNPQSTNEMQHVREESADSGLGMGSNFNLGSIPEDITGLETMDTDLDTTLTDQSTPPSSLVGCGGLQQVVEDSSNMDSTDSLMPSIQADIGDEISNDIMQSILNNSRQGGQLDGALTWL